MSTLCYYDREGYRTDECIAGTCPCKRGPSSPAAASSAEIAGTGDGRRLIPAGATWSECPELKLEPGEAFTIITYARSAFDAQVIAGLIRSAETLEDIRISKIRVGQMSLEHWKVGRDGELESCP